MAVTPEREAPGMCMICEGRTHKEAARWLELTILTHGWAVLGVEPDDPADPTGSWLYTVGATESFGIPELIITDLPTAEAHHVLNWSIETLRDGGTLEDLVADNIDWAPVHDRHLSTDLFNQYFNHYEQWPAPGRVLQLFPSTLEQCAGCVRASSTDLSDPSSRADQNPPGWADS